MRKIVAGGAAALAAIAAITRLLRPGWERIDWRKARRPGKIIEIEGTGIHYVERGSGPALVLIHGFGGHTYSFRHQIPAFAADYRVVAVDLKGFGYSEKPRNSDYSLTWQAGMVAKLMEALGIARADVVGHSMGGEVAMRLAAAYPEKVEKLVLAASVSGGRIWTLPPIRLFTPFVLLVARLFGKRIFKRLFYDPRHATEEVRRAYLAPTHIKGYGNALYETARDTRKEGGLHSGGIRAPVLILWADHDKILPGFVLRQLKNRFSRAEVVEIAMAGHLLLEERPEEVNRVLRAFLGTLETAAGRPAEAVGEVTADR